MELEAGGRSGRKVLHDAADAANPYPLVISAGPFALGVRVADDFVTAIDFLPPRTEIASRDPFTREVARQLRAYFEQPAFSFSLPLATQGSLHQQKVWDQIAAIPCGETTTYGELARCIRSAPRAVGQACGANPYPVVVPCHRVVSRSLSFNGGLGGFAREGGDFLLGIKRWLLRHEGVSAYG